MSTKIEQERERLGRLVRELWIQWAEKQPDPKPSWLVEYDQLSESDKEADRVIGYGLLAEFNAEMTGERLEHERLKAAARRVVRCHDLGTLSKAPSDSISIEALRELVRE